MNRKGNLLLIGMLFSVIFCQAQLMSTNKQFTKADTLRGSITGFRKNWDVLHYALAIKINIADKTISGSNEITYFESLPIRQMQIDLQAPLVIDSITDASGNKFSYNQDGNAWFVRLRPDDVMIKFKPGERKIKVYYSGIPREAKRAPWDGGLVWKNDKEGNPWITTACQGLGASAWWPCKDHQGDEPDRGVTIAIIAPDTLVAVSNGRMLSVTPSQQGQKTWTWQVVNPINTYSVSMNIGKYVSWNDTLKGEGGKLDLQYWVLAEDLLKAKSQFNQVKSMLQCFENWFGKYPWYEDSYKLVQVNYLGMEHQSAVAYGNGFMNGYLGRDLSGTGYGSNWDYIIVHESGHEWFGNNITTNDIADMWVHEGFTNYSEVLYTECLYGKAAGDEYCKGIRKNIVNKQPVIGPYGVNEGGSGDMYSKGANLIHIIRQTIDDDVKFKTILRGLNKTFYHATVTSSQVEQYISAQSGIDFSKVFDQYLRNINIPVLQYYFSKDKKKLFYRWSNCIPGFNLQLVLKNVSQSAKLSPTTAWSSTSITSSNAALYKLPQLTQRYYIQLKEGSN